MTTAGVVTKQYKVSNDYGGYPAITPGPDGALWFTLQNAIGRLTTSGTLTKYEVPPNGIYQADPNSIVVGPDGALWFTEAVANIVGQVTTSGAITEYYIPTSNPSLNSMTTGPDGALWFTEISASKIGRITTSGVVTEYSLPSGYGLPWWIAPGPDGAMWFTEPQQAIIGRVTTNGSFSNYSVPFKGSYPGQMIAGSGGSLWYSTGASIGEVVFVTANLSVSPDAGVRGTPLTFLGSGFTPGERVDIYTAGFDSAALASTIADRSGAVTATGLATQAVNGPRLFLGSGQTSGKVGAANFEMSASLILSPSSGPPGTVVTAAGFGFDQMAAIDFHWDALSNPSLGTVTVSLHGGFGRSTAFTFSVPAGAAPGSHPVVAGGAFAPTAIANFEVQ